MILRPLLKGLEAIWMYIGSSESIMQHDVSGRTTPSALSKSPESHSSLMTSRSPSILEQEEHLLDNMTQISPLKSVSGWTKSHDQPFFNIPSEFSAELYSYLSYIPTGFHPLILAPGTLSTPILTLLYRISTLNGLLNHNLPSASITRGGKPLLLSSVNASNLQELERCVTLLCQPTLTLLERSICISILTILMICSRSEKMSAVWEQQTQRHSVELLQTLNDPVIWGQLNEDEKRCFLWSSIDLAASLVPPMNWRNTWPSDGGRGDKRLVLAMGVVRKYKNRYAGGLEGVSWRGNWEDVEGEMMRFFWTDGCKLSWKRGWALAEMALVEETAERFGR
jgi:hypothetical protein